MAVISALVIDPNLLPTFEALRNEAERAGDPIDLYDVIDLKSHTGYLPVRAYGEETGFEYYFQPIAVEGLPAQAGAFGTHQVITRTFSDFGEGRAALIFLGVLARLTGGAYVYPDDEIVIPPGEVSAYLTEQIDAYSEEITRQNTKQQRLQKRRDRTNMTPASQPKSGFWEGFKRKFFDK